MLADFQICISVPLTLLWRENTQPRKISKFLSEDLSDSISGSEAEEKQEFFIKVIKSA